ncbi:unannotated protein [freshwater metagenome]|uniref:Unannotated protein n=1 Tax=freshwater metagenome TaxID=449393 RepID=A0A6J7KZS8_9ZZZZ
MTGLLTGLQGGRIDAVGLTKSFGGFVAVDNVDISIDGAGVTALIGPNGAGKSTLFNLICGQLTPDAGSVHINGMDFTGSPPHLVAQQGVARGFQDVRLFPSMTVLANVMVYAQPQSSSGLIHTMVRPFHQFRLNRELRATAMELLDYLSIAQLADQECGSLGFAQQKLVAIARLLALRPRVLMLDEPASGLDHDGREVLTDAITHLASDGLTICFVEHNTEMVRRIADRVVFLAQGKILASGTSDEVFNHSSLAEAYLGIA